MDRRVKERLIGASILVAVIVLVVPELLSGPKPAAPQAPMLPAAAAPEAVRNVMVDLSTSKPPTEEQVDAAADAQAQAQTQAQGTAAASPAPPPSSPNSIPSNAPEAAVKESAPAKPIAMAKSPARAAPVESPAPSPTSVVHGSWSVQLGSFASRANADNLTRQMKGQGFPAFVLIGGSGSSVRYRVRVGPLPDRESAERMAAKLKAAGHVSSLVAPAG